MTRAGIFKVAYAASVALSQGLATFAQVRAEQETIAKMTDKEVNELLKKTNGAPRPIGFAAKMREDSNK